MMSQSNSYILYGGRFTRAQITEMVFAEGDIKYELREVDMLSNQHRTQEYLDINSTGLIPVLITPEGDRLYETHAINLYICDRHGLTQLAPHEGDPGRGLFLSGLFYIATEFEPAMKRFYYPHRYTPEPEFEQKVKEIAWSHATDRLSVMESKISAHGPYYLGERFSLLDLALYYWLHPLWGRLDQSKFPSLFQNGYLVSRRSSLQGYEERLTAASDDYAELQNKGKGVI